MVVSTLPTLRQKLAAAFGVAVLVLLVGIVSLIVVRQLLKADEELQRTQSILIALEDTRRALAEAESGERAYIITGDTSFLGAISSARLEVVQDLANVRGLVSGGRTAPAQIDTLFTRVEQRITQLETIAELRTSRGFEDAARMVRARGGAVLLADIRRLMKSVADSETALLREQQRTRERNARWALWIIGGGSLLAFLLAVAINAAVRRDVAEQARVQNSLRQQAEQLDDQAAELAAQNEELEYQATQLSEQAAEMEVAQSDLEAANLELSRLNVEADAARRRAEFLLAASDMLAESLEFSRTLASVARFAVPRFADWAAVDMVTDSGVSRLAIVHSDPAKEQLAMELNRRYPANPNDPRGVHHVLRTGTPELVPEIPDELLTTAARDEEHLRIIRALGLRSYMVVPIQIRDKNVGAISFVMAESGRTYTEEDLRTAQELARRAAAAMDNALLYEAAQTARIEAEQANAAKSQFLAAMSHELRTPLNAIAGYAELISIGVHGPVTDAQKEALARIQRSQKSLLSLINDILNYAKIEAGHLRVDARDVDVDEVLSGVDALVEPQMRSKSLRYRFDRCPEPCVARGDPEKIQQVVLNLLSNAIKFTPPGGEITLSSASDDENVTISVRDTGRGIPANKLESIFEPFVQIDRDINTAVQGTGLGLAISRDLARAMGGELRGESEEGVGSTFIFTLPRVKKS